MTLKVYIPNRQVRMPLDELAARLPPSVQLIDSDELPQPADFEVLVAGFPNRDLIEASPRLRAVITPFAGTPKETIEMLRDYPHISLHSIHYNVNPTAEMAVGLMLAAAKFMIPMDRELRRHDWRARYSQTPALILDGSTVTIVGYGRIGRRIGQVCRALGMRVVGIRRHAAEAAGMADNGVTPTDDTPIYPPAALHELLPTTDVLMVAAPLTVETEGMIGADELAKLPRHAILVNVGRARVVDEAALYHALHARTILAAGLDVWYHYPTNDAERAHTAPSAFPFETLDNVVMSPHRGGWISAAEGNRITELAALLIAADEGRPIPSPVDKELGY